MAEFTLFIDGSFSTIRRLDTRPENIPHKSVEWFPVKRECGEPFEGLENGVYVVRTVDPASVPAPVPDTITPRQARLALLAMGKLDTANTVVAHSDDATRISWEFASQVVRSDPGVIAFAAAIGIDETALDKLFISGTKL